MRLDRFITLNLVQPFQRVLSPVGTMDSGRSLPILMYHSVSNTAEEKVAPYYRTVTHPNVFARHMELLQTEGYRAVGLEKGLQALRQAHASRAGHTDGKKLVVVTFDDGFGDFYTNAFPILKRHKFGGTMFLPTAFIGDERRQFKTRPCMTWREVGELHQAGIEFGSHTVNHPRLVDLGWPAVEKELRDSRREIERRLETPVRAFAYPYAFPQADREFSDRFRNLLHAAGYESCVTTEIGRVRPDDDFYRLCRLPVNSADDDLLFMAKLEGAYDWLARPQAFSKSIRRKLRIGRGAPPGGQQRAVAEAV